MPANENSWLFEQQRMAENRVDKVARSYCGAGEGGWCNYVVHEEQLQRYPPGMLCFARACRLLLMFFITFCVIGLLTGWALEGSMTVLEEIDTKTEMQVPSLALCPQPWGSSFVGGTIVKDAHILSIPGGKKGKPVKWNTVTCPTGLNKDDSLYGLEDYQDLEDYTVIQSGRGHGSQSHGDTQRKPGDSKADGIHSMVASSGSSAKAPHPHDVADPVVPKLANRSNVATGAARRIALAFRSARFQAGSRSLQKSAKSASSVSLMQVETVKRSDSSSKAGGLLDGCFCINLEQNVLTFRGDRGNVQDLDYVSVSVDKLVNSNPLSKQFAFGFYLGDMLPQQWSYGDAGQTLEGDLRSEEVATGKTEFSDGTAVPRYAFRLSGATESGDGLTTTLVFGYDKYLSYVIASFASKFSFFAMMTLIITCCAAINNFGLFEIVFPERSEDGPPELEPNLALRSIFGYFCYCCNSPEEEQKKEDEEAA